MCRCSEQFLAEGRRGAGFRDSQCRQVRGCAFSKLFHGCEYRVKGALGKGSGKSRGMRVAMAMTIGIERVPRIAAH